MSDFEPCDAFSGPRAGCVFKRGTYGLGYYGDADGAQADAAARAEPAADKAAASSEQAGVIEGRRADTETLSKA